MRVAVVGSRSLWPLSQTIKGALPPTTTTIISGGATGVDSAARRYAEDQHLPFTEILPDYRRYGRRAPLIRNEAIVAAADLVVAFWDGRSRGTAHVIATAKAKGVPVNVIRM